MKINIILFTIVVMCIVSCSKPPELTEMASEEINPLLDPVQQNTYENSFRVDKSGYNFTIEPLAEYEIHAQVKSTKNYSKGWESLLSPVDFALAWGNLTQANADEHISYSQSGRWYYYRYDGQFPYDKNYIISHSANNHILPATENVKRAVHSVGTKDNVRLKGFLVKVNGTDPSGQGIWWTSSMSRSDQGNGACEVFWVKEVQIKDKIYR